MEFVGNNTKKCLRCGVYCVQHGKGGSNLLGVTVLLVCYRFSSLTFFNVFKVYLHLFLYQFLC